MYLLIPIVEVMAGEAGRGSNDWNEGFAGGRGGSELSSRGGELNVVIIIWGG